MKRFAALAGAVLLIGGLAVVPVASAAPIAKTTMFRAFKLSQNSFVQGSSSRLSRGRLWNQLGVTCHVAASTVLCLNAANRGFIIGNGRYRTF